MIPPDGIPPGHCQINCFCVGPRGTAVREQPSVLLRCSLCCGDLSPDLTSVRHLLTILSRRESMAPGTAV